jgi:hypothetical protein
VLGVYQIEGDIGDAFAWLLIVLFALWAWNGLFPDEGGRE